MKKDCSRRRDLKTFDTFWEITFPEKEFYSRGARKGKEIKEK